MNKNLFLEEMLKKYSASGCSPYVQQEDTQSDLAKIKSLMKWKLAILFLLTNLIHIDLFNWYF